mmetsp:Transcript_39203/g.47468  ORF Transcript_39203/g.47468 Transcript_39203/m.47468 type:complete len:1112 (+) Transcript_39203:2-3337(+)
MRPEPSDDILVAPPLVPHPELHIGKLDNGLKYVIFPNSVPPNRFEAHIEIHAGSVDEHDDEQGLAHFVEHVTFLGSKKREKLLGTGARSNAYTDFHHTVFHVHAPLVSVEGNQMLPQVLEALDDIAFHPQFLATRVEKERRAVLSEAQMMNTIEYRVDCQLLQSLHAENKLGHRFPIGSSKRVEISQVEHLRAFHKRWYFPANATLYIVGDFGRTIPEVEQLIETAFGHEPLAREELPDGSMGPVKQRHQLRPPVLHAFGTPFNPDEVPGGSHVAQEAGVNIFRHALQPQFSLSLFQKVPVSRVDSLSGLRNVFMYRIVLSTLQFRINQRYMTQQDPTFVAIEFDHSDSAREGCAVSTLTVTAEAAQWKEAMKVAVEEVRRLYQHGCTEAELTRYSAALMRDSEQLAQQSGRVPSVDNLDFVMEQHALGHTVMDQAKAHESLMEVSTTVDVEDVNAVAESLLGYIANYKQPDPKEVESGVCTAIVACVPDTPETADVTEEALINVLCAPDEGSSAAYEEVTVPDQLITQGEVEQLLNERRPAFVPVQEGPAEALSGPDPVTGVYLRRLSNGVKVNYQVEKNEPGGASIRVEVPGGRAMEKALVGKDGWGSVTIGMRTLSEVGTVHGWVREQTELFCLQHLVSCELDCDEEFMFMEFRCAVGDKEGEADGMRAVLEILHLLIEKPQWQEAAMARSKNMYLSHFQSQQKSLERATSCRLIDSMVGDDRRLKDPCEEDINALSLDWLSKVIATQLKTENLEVSIVGDVDPAKLDNQLLAYLGTLTTGPMFDPKDVEDPINLRLDLPPHHPARNQRFHLYDSDERACAYMAGPAPNKWGKNTQLEPSGKSMVVLAAERQMAQKADMAATGGGDMSRITDMNSERASRVQHPLFSTVSLMLMVEILNSRLFTTVRDALGLTYDVSFEMRMFERLESGWFVLAVTSMPSKIDDALAASLRTIRALRTQPIRKSELDRARRTLLTRHESDMKDNLYLLGLITHLQSECVPEKTVDCIKDLLPMLTAATVEDIYAAYDALPLENSHLFSCIGTSGKQPPGQQQQQASAPAPTPTGTPQNENSSNILDDPKAAAAALLQAMKAVGMGNNKPEDPPTGNQQ